MKESPCELMGGSTLKRQHKNFRTVGHVTQTTECINKHLHV